VHPRLQSGGSGRPLNFTVRPRHERRYFVKKLAQFLLTVVIFTIVWGIYSWHRAHTLRSAPAAEHLESQERGSASQDTAGCDGRTYCSQMTSCAEAKYFLAHCPNVKMDGDHDGIPCEQQWCTGG
jgi:hypothetical protein